MSQPYFDSSYFDPAYFDEPQVSVGGGPVVWAKRVLWHGQLTGQVKRKMTVKTGLKAAVLNACSQTLTAKGAVTHLTSMELVASGSCKRMLSMSFMAFGDVKEKVYRVHPMVGVCLNRISRKVLLKGKNQTLLTILTATDEV